MSFIIILVTNSHQIRLAVFDLDSHYGDLEGIGSTYHNKKSLSEVRCFYFLHEMFCKFISDWKPSLKFNRKLPSKITIHSSYPIFNSLNPNYLNNLSDNFFFKPLPSCHTPKKLEEQQNFENPQAAFSKLGPHMDVSFMLCTS